MPLRREVVPLIGVAIGAVLTVVNAVRLSENMADRLGPVLWLSAMVIVVLSALATLRVRPAKTSVWFVLLALLLIGAALRIPALDSLPMGINADEGDRAASAFDVLDGRAPESWFDSGWFFINMVYFRLLALDMSIFGTGVGGGRMLNAIVGIGFLAALAWLAIRQFGWRIGLVTLALATASTLVLHNSRMVAETGPTALLWVISIACFLEGARSGRVAAFAIAGLSGGLSLYFYPSARLWAIGAVLTVVVIWLQTHRGRELPLLRGFAVAGVASVMAAMPFLMHLRTTPFEVAGRYEQTAVLDPNNQNRLSYLRPPEPLPSLILLQTERTLGMLDRYPDGGGFLPLPNGRPLFPQPVAAAVMIAIVFGIVRGWRDVRLSILSIWLMVGLSGVLLTVETPNLIRAVGILPSLYPLLALTVVELVDRVLEGASMLRPSGARATLSWLAPAGLAGVILATDAAFYIRSFRDMPAPWGNSTREGQVVARLGEIGPVYSLEINEHLVISGWVRLLAPHALRGRVPNPGRELPMLTPVQPADVRPGVLPSDGQGMSFLMTGDPNQLPYQDLLYRLYPGGMLQDADDQRRAYVLPPAAVAATRGVMVRDERQSATVDRFGQVPAGWSGCAACTWSAGILLPRSGEYALAGEQVRIDGVPVRSRVRATRGLHFVETSGTVRVNGAELQPAQTYPLMDAPWGLLGRVERGAAVDPFLDATVSMAFFEPELIGTVSPNIITWTGLFVAPRTGMYRMAFAAEDQMQLRLDGQPVTVLTVGPDQWRGLGQGSLLAIVEGQHEVRITLDVTHGGRELARWSWVPPLPDGGVDSRGEWSVVPPMVLRPENPVQPLD